MENKSLRGLVVCRNFLQDPVIKALLAVQEQGDNPFGKHEAAAVLLERAEQLGLSGNILRQYFLYLLGEGDTVAAEAIERSGKAGTGMTKALLLDMTLLWPYLQKAASDFLGVDFLDNYEPAVPKVYGYVQTLKRPLWRRRRQKKRRKSCCIIMQYTAGASWHSSWPSASVKPGTS